MPPSAPGPRRNRRRSLAAALVIAGLGATGGATVAAADHVRVEVRQATDSSFEVLGLRCGVRQTDRGAAVACRWSPPTISAAAGLRLWRITIGSDEGRRLVFRTEDTTVTGYTDVPVRRGHRYLYVIQAVDAAGRTVGLSRPAIVGVPVLPDRPDVEVLRLECAAGDEPFTAGCSWSAPTASRARALTLWRSVDGGAREAVLSSGPPFPTAYRDSVPTGTSRVAYSVIATDGDGRVVARSRTAGVVFRDVPVTDVRPTDVRPSDVRPTDVRPTDVRPTDVRPSDVRPSDVRPSDVRPSDVHATDVPPPDQPLVEAPPSDRAPARPDDRPGSGD